MRGAAGLVKVKGIVAQLVGEKQAQHGRRVGSDLLVDRQRLKVGRFTPG